MPQLRATPGEVEVHGTFSQHSGPRIVGAGLRIQFHYNQTPGIHFKADVPSEFREAILKGLRDGLRHRFPQFPESASIWITQVDAHDVDSSSMAFYRAARMVVEQAYSLMQTLET